jgi:hypothetical protein
MTLLSTFLSVFREKHKYWSKQPVSRDHTEEGIISNLIPFPLRIKQPNQLVKVDPDNKSFHNVLANFLSTHYVKGYVFNENDISWYLSHPYLNGDNILNLKNENMLIANIVAKPYKLCLKNNIINTHYVDLLTVHKDHRSKNYAPLVISHTAKESSNKYSKVFIFKIEQKRLPFNHICKMKFYSYATNNTLSPNNSHVLNDSTSTDMVYIKQLYNTICSGYKCYPIFDEYQSKYIYSSKPGVYESLIIMENGIRKGVLTYVVNDMTNYKYRVMEIVLLLYEGTDYMDLFKQINKHCHTKKINVILCLNIGENNNFIRNFDFVPGLDTYLYMYNYHINGTLRPSDILFNFI